MSVITNTQIVNDQKITINIEVENLPTSKKEGIYGDQRSGTAKRMAKKVLEVSEDVFGEGLKLASNCAVRVVESIKEMDPEIRPDEYELCLAIELGGEGNAAIVKGSADAQLQVTMTWMKGES